LKSVDLPTFGRPTMATRGGDSDDLRKCFAMLNRSANENKKTDNNLRHVILRTGERNDAAAIPPFY